MSYIDRIREANQHDPALYVPFRVAGNEVGKVRREFCSTLAQWTSVFRVLSSGVTLSAELDAPDVEPDRRTERVAGVIEALHGDGHLPHCYGELFAVSCGWKQPPLLLLERAALPLFGIRGYGVHMNGYTRRGGEPMLWVARRASHRPTFPGKLDHLVAGGQPWGMGLRENLIKECEEEANIPQELSAQAIARGRICYAFDTARGFRPDCVFAFDLELPADFEPRNNDGEVESFELWNLEKVAARIRDTTDFKFNSALVVMGFLLRHGMISKDHREFDAICAALEPDAR